MTIEKLRAVKRAILAEPELYDQANPPNWAYGRGGCDGPCCLAGWALWNECPDPKAYAARVRTSGEVLLMECLGVNAMQADLLFAPSYRVDGRTVEVLTAEDGEARIEHFIKTGGAA